jgi:hypothetical protein
MNAFASALECIIDSILASAGYIAEIKAEGWGAIASVISAIFPFSALIYTHKQWEKINAKIGMIEESGKATEILPAWYTRRMMDDTWLFGLYTRDGRVILIESIAAVSDDGAWLDVDLASPCAADRFKERFEKCVFAVDSDRTRASVRVDAIVSAVDLQTS